MSAKERTETVQRDERGHFKKGNGGRPRGAANKTTKELKAMILAALDKAGGERYLVKQATINPRAFLALLGRILPLQVTGKDGAPLEVTMIEQARAKLLKRLGDDQG